VAPIDCAELPVTFSTREGQVIALVARGDGTAIEAQEGAEGCHLDLSHINPSFASLIAKDHNPDYLMSIDGGGTK
jgi:N-acetylmuramic acid 6-phosphate (MurNAc-6-P) etherase